MVQSPVYQQQSLITQNTIFSISFTFWKVISQINLVNLDNLCTSYLCNIFQLSKLNVQNLYNTSIISKHHYNQYLIIILYNSKILFNLKGDNVKLGITIFTDKTNNQTERGSYSAFFGPLIELSEPVQLLLQHYVTLMSI